MANMLPSTVAEATSSPAEHAMFARIRDELSSDWIVLHSLGLTIHDAKPWAEIDFVLIGPPGVICLEVKGGLISRQDGIWYTTPQHGSHAGQPRRLHESPFEQVGSASAQLYKFIQRASPEAAKAITGYAIATPDVEWTIRGPDIDLALVYDQRDRARPFADFIDRVFRRWNQRIGGPSRSPKRSTVTTSRPCWKASAATSISSLHCAPAPRLPTANWYGSPTSNISFSPGWALTPALSPGEAPVPARRS